MNKHQLNQLHKSLYDLNFVMQLKDGEIINMRWKTLAGNRPGLATQIMASIVAGESALVPKDVLIAKVEWR